jgi:hypothetical protein
LAIEGMVIYHEEGFTGRLLADIYSQYP